MSTPNERTEDKKVTLEALLRLKRAERPEPEFWQRFEHDLRAKQLAAIVEPRPWWVALRLPQAARMVARFQVPVGAAAVLALGFVVIREYRPASGVSSPENGVVAVVAAETPSSASTVASAAVKVEPLLAQSSVDPVIATQAIVARADVRESSTITGSPMATVISPVEESLAEAPALAGATASGNAVAGSLTAMIPWATEQAGTTIEVAPPVVLGELPQVHFASAISPGREHDFAGRVEVIPTVAQVAETGKPADVTEKSLPAAVVAAVVPAASPVSQREVRRSRILASLVVADNASEVEGSTLAQVREVLTGSIDDDRSYGNVRRVGMGGDRLTLKF